MEKSPRIQTRTVHSIWGQLLQAQSLMGLPMNILPFTTLNEKHQINHNNRLQLTDKLVCQYYCIGWGGHENITASDKPHITDIIEHDPSDAGLYQQMPFVLRRRGNDLTDEQKQRYRLRKLVSIKGVEYIAYYLKKFEIKGGGNQVLLETIIDGESTTVPYTPRAENLSPVKPELSPREVETASNTKLRVSVNATIEFDEFDSREYREVSKILYGSAKYAVVSEIGIVAAVDNENYTSPFDGTTHPEVQAATIISFISTYHAMNVIDTFEEQLALGEKETLLTRSPVLATVGG